MTMKKTKRILLASLMSLLILFFLSVFIFVCVFLYQYFHNGIDRRTNAIVAGLYSGETTRGDPSTCYLRLTEVDEEAYEDSDGVGIFQDYVTKSFFSFAFWSIDESGERTDHVFYDFYVFPNSPGVMVGYRGYVGNQDFWFTPLTDLYDSKPTAPEDCYYDLHIVGTDEDPELYVYLYWTEDVSEVLTEG